jgi:hypothetical protein
VKSKRDDKRLEAVTSWVYFREVSQPKRIKYAWRISATIAQDQARSDLWVFTTLIDLGKHAQGSVSPRKFATLGIDTGINPIQYEPRAGREDLTTTQLHGVYINVGEQGGRLCDGSNE